MRTLKLSSDESTPKLEFSLFDYGENKPCDWRVSISTEHWVNIMGNSGRDYEAAPDPKVTLKSCLYSLTLKDLERLNAWTHDAIENLKAMKERKSKE